MQQAGIGGPSRPDSQSLSLLGIGVLGRRADEIRVDLGALIRRANLLAASFGECQRFAGASPATG